MPRLLPAVAAVLALTGGAVLLLGHQTAHALTITVDSGLDTFADDGECTLPEALENAGDTADGQPNVDCDAGDPAGPDTIDFSFSGTITLTSSLPDIETDVTIDGGGEIVLDAATNGRHTRVDGGAAVTIIGIEFTNGLETGVPGGSLRILDGSLDLVDCTFTQNNAGTGGAISVFNGTLTVEDSTFTGNSATDDGGAIIVEQGGEAVLDNVDFTMNTAGGAGGAVYVNQTTADVGLIVHGGTFVQNASGDSGGGIGSASPTQIDGGPVFTGNTAAVSGGAIVAADSLTIDTATFQDNVATTAGGALVIVGGATFSNLTVTGNQANAGGGIYADMGAPVTVTNSSFASNQALDGGGGAIKAIAGGLAVDESSFTQNSSTVHGGAIDSTDDLTVSDSTFESNTAVATGGAIYNEDAAATIVGSTFQQNSAPTGAGGAIDSRTLGPGATIAITTSTFTSNQAAAAGALAVFEGSAEVTDSTFNLNAVTGNGGAINSSGDLTITNSTISTNAADTDAGGLFNVGQATILNTTFASNSSLTGVGGIFSDGAGSLDITNTIVTTGILGENCAIGGLPTGVDGSNLSDDDSCPSGLFTQVDDVMLGALADNGGPTLTHLPDPTSPAVDGGDDAACPDKDQRGEDRIAVDHCDVGSVEVQDVPFVPTGDLFLPNLASQVDHQ